MVAPAEGPIIRARPPVVSGRNAPRGISPPRAVRVAGGRALLARAHRGRFGTRRGFRGQSVLADAVTLELAIQRLAIEPQHLGSPRPMPLDGFQDPQD